jgi:hypothetical protein
MVDIEDIQAKLGIDEHTTPMKVCFVISMLCTLVAMGSNAFLFFGEVESFTCFAVRAADAPSGAVCDPLKSVLVGRNLVPAIKLERRGEPFGLCEYAADAALNERQEAAIAGCGGPRDMELCRDTATFDPSKYNQGYAGTTTRVKRGSRSMRNANAGSPETRNSTTGGGTNGTHGANGSNGTANGTGGNNGTDAGSGGLAPDRVKPYFDQAVDDDNLLDELNDNVQGRYRIYLIVVAVLKVLSLFFKILKNHKSDSKWLKFGSPIVTALSFGGSLVLYLFKAGNPSVKCLTGTKDTGVVNVPCRILEDACGITVLGHAEVPQMSQLFALIMMVVEAIDTVASIALAIMKRIEGDD